MIYDEDSIGAVVRKMENDYVYGATQVSRYVSFSMYQDLNQIDAYLNSRHISGEQDSQGRDKPFFNICTSAVNIWYRATDIDRKDIIFKATKKSDYLLSFLATAKLQEFMTKERVGKFLNDWGLSLARYGSSVLKFIENKEGLHMMVVPWQRLIVDTIDFSNNPVIEVLELTPGQLKENKNYDQELVKKLLEAQNSRTTLDRKNKDQKANYIKIYEVHGKLPLSFLTDDEDDSETYVWQMQVISFIASKEKGKFDDYVLYKGKESRSPYMITHLIEEPGQTLSIGAVKNLFQAQWMVNHNVKSIKDQLDLASKLIFQTSDGNYANKNILSAIEDGMILTYKENMPLTQVQNNSHDITSLRDFSDQWRLLGQELNSTPDILGGKNLPSGTAYRQAAIVQQEAHSNFEMMVENKGNYIEEMMRDFIIPHLKKQLDTKEEIVATLEDYGITEIDAEYLPRKAAKEFNKKAVQAVLNRSELPDYNQELQKVAQELQSGTRFFTPDEIGEATWKEIMDDFDWDSIKVEVTGEQGNKQAILETLANVLRDVIQVAANPAIQANPDVKSILDKIREESGISPSQFKKPAMPMVQPQQTVGSVAGANQVQMQ